VSAERNILQIAIKRQTREPTAKIRRKRLPLINAEEAFFPKHGNFRADGIRDIADV